VAGDTGHKECRIPQGSEASLLVIIQDVYEKTAGKPGHIQAARTGREK
jgi:hypothetical protein